LPKDNFGSYVFWRAKHL